MTADSMLPYCRDELQGIEHPLVLAIDDDDDNLLLISYALEMFGCQFVSESDSQLAVSLAREHQPDLILLDILLPHLSGIDIIHSLKQDSHTCHIPVVAVTALASEDNRQQLLSEGFVGYISKPYMLEDLEAIIRRYSQFPKSVQLSAS